MIEEMEKELTELVQEKTGDKSLVVRFDNGPLLRIEKTKKWPDDFRGFGTNVRPKNQR